MKIKFTMPGEEEPAFSRLWDRKIRRGFYREFVTQVLGEILGVKDALSRPAAYYPQKPDEMDTVVDGMFGLVLQLTGVSRDGRTAKQFQDAYKLAAELVSHFVKSNIPRGTRVQVMVQFALDGAAECNANSPGTYTAIPDWAEFWVEGEYESAT